MPPLTTKNKQANKAPPPSKRPLPYYTLHTLKSAADLDALLSRDSLAGVSAVRFGEDFNVKDEHIIRLVEAIGTQLIALRLGSSDTGDGIWVTERAVHRIAACCPKLRELELSSCTKVGDAAFAAIAAGLSELQVLYLTGHDRVSGCLTNKSTALLAKGSLPHLQRLYITDQSRVSDGPLCKLVQKRRELVVQTGDSSKWGGIVSDIQYTKGMEQWW